MFMSQKMLPLLKNEVIRMFLWLITSLQKEKQKEESLILMNITTLGQSFIMSGSLVNVSQLRWLMISTNGLSSQLEGLGIDHNVIQDSSWMKIISKLLLILRIVLIMKLFFQTFCEKIFKSFKIIFCWCLWLNELNFSWFPRF